MKEKLPTLILRLITIASAIAGLFVCVFALPTFGATIAENFPGDAFWQYLILAGVYAAAACFFFALYQLWLLLKGIDKDQTLSVRRLEAIRSSAIVFSVLYFLFAMPVIFLEAKAEDAPGLILIGAFLDAFPIGIAAVATILARIARRASK